MLAWTDRMNEITDDQRLQGSVVLFHMFRLGSKGQQHKVLILEMTNGEAQLCFIMLSIADVFQ